MPVAGHGHVLHWCPDGFTIVTPSGLSRGNIHDHGPATITLAWMGFQVPIPSSKSSEKWARKHIRRYIYRTARSQQNEVLPVGWVYILVVVFLYNQYSFQTKIS